MMFQTRHDSKANWLLPAYYGGKMLVEEWADPTNAPHRLFPALVMEGDTVSSDVAAYVVRRPDNRWAALVLNKSMDHRKLGRIRFAIGAKEIDWSGPLDVIQYSSRQYTWKANGANGHPTRSKPPRRFQAINGPGSVIKLPSMSLTVVRDTAPHLLIPR